MAGRARKSNINADPDPSTDLHFKPSVAKYFGMVLNNFAKISQIIP